MENELMSSDDLPIINWLEVESRNIPELGYSWKILKEYYEECKIKLKNVNTSVSPFDNNKEKDDIYNLVRNKIKIESFKDECINFLGIDKSDIDNILEKKYSTPKDEWIIAKICRLYNMRLKLGHSARITYIAKYELDNMLKDNDSENIRLLKSSVILSALLHDIGRFYQAVHYNNLNDGYMKKNEQLIGNLKVDHAIAGYYYSLASAFELHKILDTSDEEAKRKLCIEALAATVVKYHQQPNSSLEHFEFDGNANSLDSAYALEELFEFINISYDNAKLMNYYVASKINSKHKKFIDEFINKIKNIINKNKIDYSDASGFNIDTVYIDSLNDEINSEISQVLKNINNKNINDVSSSIVDIINSKVLLTTEKELSSEDKSEYLIEIQEKLKDMLNYDISESIANIFKNGKQSIPDSVKFILSSSMSMTMDADKIDIFNQRALGIYNVNYNPSSYEIFPTPDTNLISLLNNYFSFDIDSNQIIIDSNIISVLNNLHKDLKPYLKSYLEEFNIYDGDSIKSNITIIVNKNSIEINDGNKTTSYNSNKLYNMFNSNWINFLCDNFNLEKLPFKEFKVKYFSVAQLSIKSNILEKNTSNMTPDERINIYRKLLVTDSLTEAFMKKKKNPVGTGWIKAIENPDSYHLVSSSISALIWQLNQFLFVNMRSVYSYKFIKDNNILDKIYEQYNLKSPIVSIILKDYIEYAKRFINEILKEHELGHINEILTGNVLDIVREKVYNDFISENQVTNDSFQYENVKFK